MPPPDPAEPADDKESERSGTPRRSLRDQHRRHDVASGTLRTGPRYTVGPPKTVPMTEPEHEEAIHALAVLIAAWWTDHPPDGDNGETQDEDDT